MTKASVLLCALLLACGNPDDALLNEDGEAGLVDSDALEARLSAASADVLSADASEGEVPFEAAMLDCYDDALTRGLRVEVHTVGRYLALGDTMMAVRVSIPRASGLARCIEDAVAQSVPPGASHAPDALASGSFAIDLGGPPPAVRPGDIERQYEEHQKGMAELMREVVARGVLPRDHPLVIEALAAESASD